MSRSGGSPIAAVISTPDEALVLLDVMEADSLEHGDEMPHKGGSWPPYRDAMFNRVYLKVLAIAGIKADPSWEVDGSGGSRDPYFAEGAAPADLVDDLAGSHDRPITDEQVERAYDAFVIGMQSTGSTKAAIRLALEAAR